MINNNFVFELPFSLDLAAIRLVALKSTSNNSLPFFQRSVNDYDLLVDMSKKFPVLGTRWNVYKFPAHQGLPIHTDGKRDATLNIPIAGGEDSQTIFYNTPNEIKSYYDEDRIFHVLEGSFEEQFKFTLTKPTVIKTTVPHSVSVGKVPRIILSWGLTVSFEEAKTFFSEYAANCQLP